MTEHVHINRSLLPFSWLYGTVVGMRNKLFDWGILRSEEFSIPVISVGNITVGGTGKTPHIEYLIRLLKKDYRVAVLSRGYKRKTSGFVLAGETTTSRDIGDEPSQIRRKFPDILVAVDQKRRRGIHKLLELPEGKRPEIILLDDAFQHRYVKPSLSILLTDSHRLIYEDVLLPAGRLRESASNNFRAGIVIVTKCPEAFKPIDYRVITKHLNLYPYQSLFFTSMRYGQITPVFPETDHPVFSLKDLKERKISVLLLAGIANPQPLEKTIAQHAHSVEKMIFPDHHSFSQGDMARLEKKYAEMPGGSKIILTTEKDAERLVNRKDISESVKNALYYLPIEVIFNLNQSTDFKQKIIEHVRTVKRNRFLD